MKNKYAVFLVVFGMLSTFCRLSPLGLPSIRIPIALPRMKPLATPIATHQPLPTSTFPQPQPPPTLTYTQRIEHLLVTLTTSQDPFELTFNSRNLWSQKQRRGEDPYNEVATDKVINTLYVALRNQLFSEIRHQIGPEAAQFLQQRLTGIAEAQPGRSLLVEIHVKGVQHRCLRRNREAWTCTHFLQSATAPSTTFFHFLVLARDVDLSPEALDLDQFPNPLFRIKVRRDTDQFTEDRGAHVLGGLLYRLPGWRWEAIDINWTALGTESP